MQGRRETTTNVLSLQLTYQITHGVYDGFVSGEASKVGRVQKKKHFRSKSTKFFQSQNSFCLGKLQKNGNE